MAADPGAEYERVIKLDLGKIVPQAAQPHSPDNVCTIKALAGKPIDQVIIGSCTNSSYRDLMMAAKILKGKKVHPRVSLAIAPGSRQVLTMIAANGALQDILDAGARLLETACGACIGMGQAPRTDGVTLRTFNRNFPGRSGTPSGQVYLVSPETAAWSAIKGVFADPTGIKTRVSVTVPKKFLCDDSLLIAPPKDGSKVEIVRGPNIAALPVFDELPDSFAGTVVLKVENNITTDHIMPAGSKILPLRSNIPKISEYVFSQVDAEFAKRAKATPNGIIVGGENYGQGSSREHAALAPRYLGIKAVIVKSFARIHRDNLVNFGILPLVFKDPADYAKLSMADALELSDVHAGLAKGTLTVRCQTRGYSFDAVAGLSARQQQMMRAGGLLNFIKQSGTK
jgi:aconitate hydratase